MGILRAHTGAVGCVVLILMSSTDVSVSTEGACILEDCLVDSCSLFISSKLRYQWMHSGTKQGLGAT